MGMGGASSLWSERPDASLERFAGLSDRTLAFALRRRSKLSAKEMSSNISLRRHCESFT